MDLFSLAIAIGIPSAITGFCFWCLEHHMEKREERDKEAVSYTHLRAHETDSYLVCRLLLEKKKKQKHDTDFNSEHCILRDKNKEPRT